MARAGGARPAAIPWTPWHIRAGWLLRSHRLRHTDPDLRRLGGFARAYGVSGQKEGGISPSTLSRWESGTVVVTAEAVRRYEGVLGLPAHHLLAPIQTVARHEGGPAAAAFLRGRYGPPAGTAANGPARPRSAGAHGTALRMDPLLDRALDGGILTSEDWDELTWWAAYGGGSVSPGRVRRAVVQRLLEETLVSSSTQWMRRFEALGRLMADPFWAPEAVAVCAEAAEQSEHVGLIEAVCALDGSPHPDAARAVIRQLTDPTTEDSRYGAMLAAARKSRKGHFGADQNRVLVDVVDGVLTSASQGAHPLPLVEAAAVLVHRLPLSAAHTARLVAAAADLHPTAGAVVLHGSLTAPAAASVTVARVLARLPDDVTSPQSGDVLGGIVHDLLHHPVADVRLYAAMLLSASPYGGEVAAALTAELRNTAVVRAENQAVPVLYALRVLGGPEQRGVVADLTLARGLPRGVVLAAVDALGHIGGRSPETYWRAVFERHSKAVPDPGEQQRVLKRLVYSFAMADELDLLTRLVGEQAREVSAQGLSRWWTHLARHVRESARR
ncbi:helix-turn-helix domain-containing protein [Actinacidiphila acidipaludis]|uniref:Helix-turn-helix transcriptional regulator n=1 Tax=Actinacidiphila acidipaludis TaxID=2873382 RepID=A0ABS7QAH8_9ACTN|nr:helix-turn-helix transcriptional regulator [Streptomyces acidipaludis]MBY8880131.1 helix-turn-helix transcriptional regulator [Streptomyces acidipaludis]